MQHTKLSSCCGRRRSSANNIQDGSLRDLVNLPFLYGIRKSNASHKDMYEETKKNPALLEYAVVITCAPENMKES